MKNIPIIFFLVFVFASCKSQQPAIKQINDFGKDTLIEDSTLRALQQQNELMLVFANENFAWSRVTGYNILAYKNGQWMAILYGAKNSVRPGSGLPQTPVSYDTFNVSQKSCDSIWQFFIQNEIWKIKGDDGKNFCAEGNKKCTINDATNWRLMMITQTKLTDASYYAPEFYEKCCPGNADRKAFTEACKKILNIIEMENR